MNQRVIFVAFCIFLLCCPTASAEQTVLYGDRIGAGTKIPNPFFEELIAKEYLALKTIQKH
jgi:hypothetical protein